MMLTAFSGMGVVMNRKAARAVKAFPAAVTDVLPCLIVVTILRVYGTSCFRRKRRLRARGLTPVDGVWERWESPSLVKAAPDECRGSLYRGRAVR